MTEDLDWSAWQGLADTLPRPTAEPIVDVVIPVYGSLNLVLQCIKSVLTARPHTPYELVVINDASPQPEVGPTLARLATIGLFTLLENEQNLGFPGTCNRGFLLHPDRDVLLLNSDTEVHNDWLDRMREHVLRNPRVGTVTPFTNDGEICSYPVFLKPNYEDLGITDGELDALAAETNRGFSVEAPTGVGFAMYVTRGCLNDVTGFDTEHFGKGYGEENELCQRALKHGWSNLIAGDVFVRHHGGGSFGARKQMLVAAGVAMAEKLQPGYLKQVASFVRRDPLAPARQALDVARLRRHCAGRRPWVMVNHAWGGGTTRHVLELADMLESDGVPVLVCQPVEPESSVLVFQDPRQQLYPNLPQCDVLRDPVHFTEALRLMDVELVHIHNLAGLPDAAPDYLLTAMADVVPYDFTFHDFQSFCPRIQLVDLTGYYCGEPAQEVCEKCLATLGPLDLPVGALWDWRTRYERLLAGARRTYAPSADTAARIRRHWPTITVDVRPHPEHSAPASEPWPARDVDDTVRIAIIGALTVAKGRRLLAEVARAALTAAPELRFVIIGYTDADHRFRDLPNVEIVGRYREDALPGLLRHGQFDAIWFPAVWPETYSYTLTAALCTPLPIVAADLGAVAERLREHERGLVYPLMTMLEPTALADLLWSTKTMPPTQPRSIARNYPHVRDSYYGFPHS